MLLKIKEVLSYFSKAQIIISIIWWCLAITTCITISIFTYHVKAMYGIVLFMWILCGYNRGFVVGRKTILDKLYKEICDEEKSLDKDEDQ